MRQNLIKHTNPKEHLNLIHTMMDFFDNGKPQVGIFWYDFKHNSLFGVKKEDADKCIQEKGYGTIAKLHKTYWTKQHYLAVHHNDTSSIFYIETNYTLIPRGRIFVKEDGTFFVTVGEWINGYINNEKVIDQDKLRELLIDEFNLPEDFIFKIDFHWNIGHGWSEDIEL